MRAFLCLGFLGLFLQQASAIPCGQFPDQTSCNSASKCVWEAQTTSCRCKDGIADFVFLIDGSGSIGQTDFDIQMSMVHDLLSQSVPANSGVGFILFSSTVRAVRPLFPRLNITDYIQIARGITYPNGATYMGEAIRMSLGGLYFGNPLETRTNLRIFLVTDGRPNGNIDPCTYKDTIATWAGLHVIILGVGTGFKRDAVTCLVQKEQNPNQWIIQIASYTKQAFAKVLPLLDTQFCPDTIDLKITEVKPLRNLNYSGPGQTALTGTIWFEFINNGLSPVPLNVISVRGLFNGFLVPPTDTRFISPGQPVVVYYSNGFMPNCLNCNCTRSVQNPNWCADAIYIGCGFGLICQVQANWDVGVTLTNWFVELYDNTGSAVLNEDSKWVAANNWPTIPSGFSYALKRFSIADNKNGRNWKKSCTEQGTPGAEPLKVCNAGCSISQCRLNGDNNATCIGNSKTCACSGQYFYPESGTCLSLIGPKQCNATLVKRAQGVYEVQYTWTSVPVPPNINYSLSYASGKSVNTYSNFQALPYSSSQWGPGLTDGEVVSLFKTFDYQGAETLYKSFPPTPCIKKTSAPTPAPTQSPITLPQLKVYVGGDICAQERCACAYQSYTCTDTPPRKQVTAFAQNEFVTVSRQPFDFQQEIVIEFMIENLGYRRRGRRLLSNNAPVTTAVPLVNGTCNNTIDVCPQQGFARIRPNSANVRIPLNVQSATFTSYRFVITSCTVGGQRCRLFYPNNITLVVASPQASTAVTTNQLPEWLWWLIGALILFLFLLALLAYQFWWKNRETSKHLDATQADLDHAIAENELGFAHDLDAGDVVFNPIATGVPGSSNAPDFFSNEVAQRRGDAANTRADVAVEKFQHREQFGQVAGPNKGNDLSQPLLSG